MNRRRAGLRVLGAAIAAGSMVGLAVLGNRISDRPALPRAANFESTADFESLQTPPTTTEASGGGQAPQPKTPIRHIVVLAQENHTFDNYFGTYPGADGLPAGVCMPVDPNRPGETDCVRPFHLRSADAQIDEDVAADDGQIHQADLDHSLKTFRAQYNGGRMDGFVAALNMRKQDGRLAMGYYDDRDLPYYWNLADQYVLFDRFFSSANAGSTLNHIFWVAAAAGGNRDGLPTGGLGNLPTIFDRLEERGISWKFYVQNYDSRLTYRTMRHYVGNRAAQVVWVPLLAMDRFIDEPNLARHIVDMDEYFEDLHNGTLPSVAYLAPAGASEHPPGSLASGQRFVVSLIHALMRSSAWDHAAFMLLYDDWGGWYDHVSPPQVDQHGYGFRVPALLVSAYARRGFVDHTVLDFTSVLRFIEDNWQIPPLAERDAFASSIVTAFDFSVGPREPRFISAQRGGETKIASRAVMIYSIYGGGLACSILLIVWAAGGLAFLGRLSTPTHPPPDREEPNLEA